MPQLDFSYDLSGVDRTGLLAEAAAALDARRVPLAPGVAGVPTTAGDAVRELMLDHASLPDSLDLYHITEQDFLNPRRPTGLRAVPVRFKELTARSNFYWLPIRVGLMPRRGWAFNRLEVKLAFNPDGATGSRPKSWQVLPSPKFQTDLKVGTRLEVGLDENFEFSAKLGAAPLTSGGGIGGQGGTQASGAGSSSAGAGQGGNQPGGTSGGDGLGLPKINAGVDASAAAGLGLVAGPFEYRVVSAKIEQNGPGMDWVFWRLDGAEFFQEDRPDLVVILEVPRSTGELKVDARMQAYRHFNFLGSDFRDAVRGIPEKLRAWFEGGLPVADAKSYDLSSRL